MFLQFFTSLRDAQVPVTLREYLTLIEALEADLAEQTVENFYYLSRTALVKDERNLDKFDRVFGTVFKGLESLLHRIQQALEPLEHSAEHTIELIEIALVLYQRGARKVVEILHGLLGQVRLERHEQRQICTH